MIDRRKMLSLLGSAGVWVTVTGCRTDAEPSTAPVPDSATSDGSTETGGTAVPGSAASAETGTDPVHLRLWAAPSTAEIVAGATTNVWSFGAEVIEGDPAVVDPSSSYLGPTLHLRTGQRVIIDFENRLDEPCIVHWHGLVVPQDQDGQPPEAVEPGETYYYDFVVHDDPGTNWYHPHPHGRTGEQVYRGLAGLIVVDEATDNNALPSGPEDLSLVLQDRRFDGGDQLAYVAMRHDVMAGFVGDVLVTNGVADFEQPVTRRPHRIRLLNGANSRTQYLTLSTGEPLHVVAVDGTLLPDTVTVDGLVLAPAQRSDLWIDFSIHDPGTRIELLSADTFVEGRGTVAPLSLATRVSATFVVDDSEAVAGQRPSGLGVEPWFDAGDAVNPDDPKQFVLSTFQAAHWINNTQFEGRVADDVETASLGTVELWEFVNESPMAHPMHLHGESFRVVHRSWDSEVARAPWDQIAHGVIDSGLRDTVLVWPGERVRIAVPFTKHLGYFLYHCHILEHEDAGMMRYFHIVEPGAGG